MTQDHSKPVRPGCDFVYSNLCKGLTIFFYVSTTSNKTMARCSVHGIGEDWCWKAVSWEEYVVFMVMER